MDISQIIALAPLMALAVAILLVMLGLILRRNFLLTTSLAAAGLVMSLLILVATGQETATPVTLLMCIDRYAHFYMLFLLLAGLAVLGFCYDYFNNREGENEELVLLLLTAILGACVLVASSHFATFFMGLEILSISLFALIGYPLTQSRPLEAAIKYLVLSGLSSALLLMGMALVYAQSGQLSFGGLRLFMASHPAINSLMLGGILLLLAGISFKLSLIPFHLWTPDIYEGAPAPIAGFIAIVSKGAVFALALRFFTTTHSYQYAPLLTVLGVLAVLSILGGNLLALLQTNVKRILAYSSIAHMGYLMVALIAAGSQDPSLAIEAVSFYWVAYGITTLGAFGVVSVLSTPRTEAGDPCLYHGLFWRRPWLAGAFTLMLLSLIGIPLTAGFIGKFYIFTSGADGQLWGLLSAVVIGSGMGLYYYLKIIMVMSMNLPVAATPEQTASQWLSLAMLAILSVLLLGLGVYPAPLVDSIQSVAHSVVDQVI